MVKLALVLAVAFVTLSIPSVLSVAFPFVTFKPEYTKFSALALLARISDLPLLITVYSFRLYVCF